MSTYEFANNTNIMYHTLEPKPCHKQEECFESICNNNNKK